LYTLHLLESATAKIFAQVTQKGKITRQDSDVLMTEFLNKCLSPEEEILINRLLYAVRRGKLELVN
jgi:hypothetical protein